MRDLYRLLAGFCAAALCLALVGCQNKQDSIEIPTSDPATAETAATPEQSAPAASALPVGTDATVLPQTPDAGRSYVDETLFIGDSNTARYMMYADETGTAFTSLKNNIGVVSMGAGAITTLKCEQFKGDSQMYTIPDAVAKLKPKRIIICFGTNNLGGSSTDATGFISTYEKGLKAIVDAWPYADLIVSAIPPLDKQRENTNLTMTQVDAYNAALVKMCEENGFKFLNSSEVLRDSATGWARTDYTLSDGVHLSKTAVTAYFEYVRTHAYITEDRRPQPLGTIPTPDGVPANLISEDPIAVRGAKVPLEFVATHGGSLSGATSQLVKKGGTSSAVTAVPAEGFVFAGWTSSTGATYSSATIQFTMPADANAGGVVLTAHFTPDAHEHDYVLVPGSETAATCLNAGTAKYECSICGEVIEKETPALGHDWDGGSRSGDQITYTCRRCGEKKTETVAHTHDYSTVVSDTPATCTSAEVIVLECSCGAQATTTGQGALGHAWDGGVPSDSQIVYTCTRCGATYTEAAPPSQESSSSTSDSTPATPNPTPIEPPSTSDSGSSDSGSSSSESSSSEASSSSENSPAPPENAPPPATDSADAGPTEA